MFESVKQPTHINELTSFETMNKLYTITTAAFAFVLMFNAAGLQAQSVEGEPAYDYVFTPYYPEDMDNMPITVREATQPAISATPVSEETMKVWYNALMGTSQLELYSLNGQVMRQETVGNDRERAGMLEISTAGLTPGLYIVRLTSGAYKVAQKIILR